MQDSGNETSESKTIPAESSRKAARIFYYGNILAVLVPFPFFILWFGASMFVYAMLRHHPNSRVGYHTQQAAYQYYAVAGLLVPLLTFAPGDFFLNYWLHTWIVCVAIVIPMAIYKIMKINQESWYNVQTQV